MRPTRTLEIRREDSSKNRQSCCSFRLVEGQAKIKIEASYFGVVPADITAGSNGTFGVRVRYRPSWRAGSEVEEEAPCCGKVVRRVWRSARAFLR
jgi:hypothetical protein